MLLRASGDLESTYFSLPDAIAGEAGSGVSEGAELAAFTEAVLRRDDAEIRRTREPLVATIGAEATVDAAAVVSVFTMLNRVANSTGLPLDGLVDAATGKGLGIDGFMSARDGRLQEWPWTWLRRLVGPVMETPALAPVRRFYWWLIRNG